MNREHAFSSRLVLQTHYRYSNLHALFVNFCRSLAHSPRLKIAFNPIPWKKSRSNEMQIVVFSHDQAGHAAMKLHLPRLSASC